MEMNIKIKVNDLKLTVLIIASLFILGQAFLTLADEKTNPGTLFLDSDQDGLADQEETAYGTNPLNSDSDGDGYTDGAEIKSGYDPLKPAPGDKLPVVETKVELASQSSFDTGANKNLTEALMNKISDVNNLIDNEENLEEITAESVKTFAQNLLTEQVDFSQEIPMISIDDIKIKEQNYSKFSDEKAEEKKNEDFNDYIVSIFYVLSLNSEKPIVSAEDFTASFVNLAKEIVNAMTQSDTDYFENLDQEGQKTIEELKKNVEVPEEILEIHMEMLSLAGYGLSLKSSATKNPGDPFLNLVNMSKIQGFLNAYSDLVTKIKNSFGQYDLNEDYVKEKLEKLGVDTSQTISDESFLNNYRFIFD